MIRNCARRQGKWGTTRTSHALQPATQRPTTMTTWTMKTSLFERKEYGSSRNSSGERSVECSGLRLKRASGDWPTATHTGRGLISAGWKRSGNILSAGVKSGNPRLEFPTNFRVSTSESCHRKHNRPLILILLAAFSLIYQLFTSNLKWCVFSKWVKSCGSV